LTPKSIESLLFKVPPLKEQEAIAEALSDADAAIESLDALITKKRDVKQATMQQLLTGRTRLPGFNADWKEVRLGDLGVCLRGVSYKGDSDLSDGDTPKTVRLLRSNNVQNSLIQFNDVQYVNHDCVSDEQILRRDDIVICMANGSKVLVGKTGLYKDSQDARYTFGAFMGCFRSLSDQAHAIFVRYLFLTKQYQDYISNLLAGSSINNLTPKSIESLLFKVPPLKEQEAIAEALSEIDDELEELTKQVTKLRMVKEGMMQDLLTGKVRLA
jgi:type I restriction enzyme S subunit